MDIKDLMLTTDAGTPYVIKKFSGSFTITSSHYGTDGLARVTHGLPFTPLLIGMWIDSNRGVYQDIANERPDGPFSMPTIIEGVTADSTYIYMEINDTKYPYETSTYSFRIACLAPPDFTGDTGVFGSEDSTDFTYSSDFTSPAIVKSGFTNIASNATATIPHGLSFAPRVRVWTTRKLRYSTYTYGSGLHTVQTKIDNTNIYIKNGSSPSSVKYYYHIYGDDVWV